MTRVLIAVAGIALVVCANAMPTDEEIKKVSPVIEQLTAGDYEAMRAGRKTRSQMAETLVGYVKDAESEAAKFILLRDAFGLYLGAAEFSKALDAYSLLNGNVKDVPKGTLGAWSAQQVDQFAKKGRADGLAFLVEKAVADGDAESAAAIVRQIKPYRKKLMSAQAGPQLQMALNRVERLERGMSELRALRQSVRKRPDDPALREKLGFALAVAGDWDGALKEFAQTSGKIAEAAAWERSYPETGVTAWTTETVAGFWWERAEQAKDASAVAAACRRHAAKWYRVAIDNGTLTGLKKKLAEKRIAETEKDGAAESVINSAVQPPSGKGKPIKFSMGKGVVMELMPCPAGKFEMGYNRDKGYSGRHYSIYPHLVTITRPFWIGKFPVTQEQWECLEKIPKSPTKEVLVWCKAWGKKIPMTMFHPLSTEDLDRFIAQMNKKYRRFLPQGYVFRLPTMAEWEYACRANGDPAQDWYAMRDTEALSPDDFRKFIVTLEDRRGFVKNKGLSIPDDKVSIWPVAVGNKPPNPWGVSDLKGNVRELTLDRFPADTPLPWHGWGNITPEMVKWERMDVDPLFWNDDERAVGTVVNTYLYPPDKPQQNRVEFTHGVRSRQLREFSVGFRLVAGPDLLQERKRSAAKRSADPATKATVGKPVSETITASVKDKVKMHTIKLNEKVSMEFVECPAGSFMMGFEKGKNSAMRRHKVTFTRPFWIARTKLTLRQYRTFDKTFTVPKELAATAKDDNVPLSFRYFGDSEGGKLLHKNIHFFFCKELTERFKDEIPEGYVFRLPTEAEWEYAYTANETNPNDFYGASGDLLHKWPKSKWQKYMFDNEMLKDRIKKLCNHGWGIGVAVGQLKPNRWGLYDMAGNLDERTIDFVEDSHLSDPNQAALIYEDEEIDPIRPGTEQRPLNIARGGNMGKWGKRTGGCSVRLVVGPDLQKEK